MIEVLGLLGAKALFLTYAWLLSAIIASLLSGRKGYGEKPGLATGLVLTVFGVLIWLFVPAKDDSRWKLQGPLGRKGGGKSLAELRAETDPSSSVGTGAPAGTGTGAGQEAAGDPGGQMGRAKG